MNRFEGFNIDPTAQADAGGRARDMAPQLSSLVFHSTVSASSFVGRPEHIARPEQSVATQPAVLTEIPH